MTDQEIIHLMYDHADGFSSCIQFKDDAAVIAFARAVLAHTPVAEPQQPSYTAALSNFQARADSVIDPPQPPTDQVLLELMPETMRDEFSYAAEVCSGATGGQVAPGIFRGALDSAALEYAQAVLARYA